MNESPDSNHWPGKMPGTPQFAAALQQLAREMRANPTPAERNLWSALRAGQRLGFKFRRQHIIDRYIVDFYCVKARLVIEVDGEVHRFQSNEDAQRQADLETMGLMVMRFSNDDVLKNREGVVAAIDQFLNGVTG